MSVGYMLYIKAHLIPYNHVFGRCCVRGNTDIIDQAGRRRDARTDGSAWSGINEMKRN